MRRLVAVMFGARPDDIDGKTINRAQQEKAREAIGRLVAKARLSHIATKGCRLPSRPSAILDVRPKHATTLGPASGPSQWAKTTNGFESPLDGPTGYNVKEDRRHDRRTFPR